MYTLKEYRILLKAVRWENQFLKKLIKTLPNGEQKLNEAYEKEKHNAMKLLNDKFENFKVKIQGNINEN